MIISFVHKGLEKFYQTGNTSGIQAVHAKKLRLILTLLDELHKLKGDKKDIWSVTVQANWRVTFRFIASNAEVVNYEDYH